MTESFVLPPILRSFFMSRPSTYRFRALASEPRARDAVDKEVKGEWTEIAIEWHALAARTILSTGSDDLTLE